jgi:hypothetical protein
MNRREFILGTSAAVLAVSATRLFVGDEGDALQRRPDPTVQASPALAAIAFGLHAPNPHNTQAWKFQVLSATKFLFYIDATRILPMTDPLTRQVHIGCGAFLEALTIGMTSLGHAAKCTLFPDGLTSVKNLSRPLALVEIDKLQGAAHPLAQVVRRRGTSRLTYTHPWQRAEFEKMLREYPFLRARVRLIDSSLPAIRTIALAAMEAEMRTKRTSEESRQWFRASQYEISKHADGISLPGLGIQGIKRWLLETFTDLKSPQDWYSQSTFKNVMERFSDSLESTHSFVTLTTEENGPRDWVQAGRDYLVLQAAAFTQGIYLHPLSQALQEFPEVTPFQNQLNHVLGVHGNQKIQMLARAGRSVAPWVSHRQSLAAYVD